MASKSERLDDPRLNEIIESVGYRAALASQKNFVILGHADDEGIKLNRGRIGAAQAPDEIRACLNRLTPGKVFKQKILDIGNLESQGELSLRQEELLTKTAELFRCQHKIISFGGGHDHAYSDVGAFIDTHSHLKPLVINIDAHLDMRPDTMHASPNSGTPFFQLYESGRKFELIQIGIQPFSASLEHLKYAKSRKVKVYFMNECDGQLLKIFKSIKAKNRPVFLSIDLDAFSSAYAPGVSAPSPIGLNPVELIKVMPWIFRSWNMKAMGLYEVSPPFDIDRRTSKLAAQLTHAFMLYDS